MHWEGDLLIGSRQGPSIAALVERSIRYVVLVKLASLLGRSRGWRLQRQLQHLPAEAFKTLI